MDKQIINSNSIVVKPARTAKSGKALKAVFGRWESSALITSAGRLASRKDFGVVRDVKGAQLTTEYAKAQADFNSLGEVTLASEQSQVAKGTREMKRIYTDPKNGYVHLVTAPSNKAGKVVKILEEAGIGSEVLEKVLGALKLA